MSKHGSVINVQRNITCAHFSIMTQFIMGYQSRPNTPAHFDSTLLVGAMGTLPAISYTDHPHPPSTEGKNTLFDLGPHAPDVEPHPLGYAKISTHDKLLNEGGGDATLARCAKNERMVELHTSLDLSLLVDLVLLQPIPQPANALAIRSNVQRLRDSTGPELH